MGGLSRVQDVVGAVNRYWITDALPAYGDQRGRVRAPRVSTRDTRFLPPRKYGRHCVHAPDGQVVRCFIDREIAAKVLRGFGPNFTLKYKV